MDDAVDRKTLTHLHLKLEGMQESLSDDIFYLISWGCANGWFRCIPKGADTPMIPAQDVGRLLGQAVELITAADPKAKLRALADICEPIRFQVLLAALRVKVSQGEAQRVASLLIAIARDWIGEPQSKIDILTQLARSDRTLKPSYSGLAPKERHRGSQKAGPDRRSYGYRPRSYYPTAASRKVSR
jgi:hypothetical protein